MKKGLVYKKELLAGLIWENEDGYFFQYDSTYIQNPQYGPVSRTLPVREELFTDKNMIPFFDGLIPEGWLLKIAIDNWKLNPRDRMSLLLTLCRDCIGDISIINTI
ncbi:HipA N-terminal domain-containing protein [Flavobacterium sp. N1736]|uniref:HipA N-terminal domain-containing protein n=1 Tax=Flavobacterium sp. N1736 TaxID=2986823 RepID=UPI002224D64B|nr:HipA N-terminal domain-containing protein [Flavobacterium sp. N1736]